MKKRLQERDMWFQGRILRIPSIWNVNKEEVFFRKWNKKKDLKKLQLEIVQISRANNVERSVGEYDTQRT